MSASLTPLVLIDTNVLLAATDRDRSSHQAAVQFLSSETRRVAISPQIVREYLAISTRPVEANGLGLSAQDATANIGEFLDVLDLLPEALGTTAKLLELIEQVSTSGKQVHDANLVAVALVHGATAIVTDNVSHFARFGSLIAVERLGRFAADHSGQKRQ